MASSPQTKRAASNQDRIRALLGQYGIGIVLIIMMVVIAIITWLIQKTEKKWVHYN